jgi:hypothetical protein
MSHFVLLHSLFFISGLVEKSGDESCFSGDSSLDWLEFRSADIKAKCCASDVGVDLGVKILSMEKVKAFCLGGGVDIL